MENKEQRVQGLTYLAEPPESVQATENPLCNIEVEDSRMTFTDNCNQTAMHTEIKGISEVNQNLSTNIMDLVCAEELPQEFKLECHALFLNGCRLFSTTNSKSVSIFMDSNCLNFQAQRIEDDSNPVNMSFEVNNFRQVLLYLTPHQAIIFAYINTTHVDRIWSKLQSVEPLTKQVDKIFPSENMLTFIIDKIGNCKPSAMPCFIQQLYGSFSKKANFRFIDKKKAMEILEEYWDAKDIEQHIKSRNHYKYISANSSSSWKNKEDQKLIHYVEKYGFDKWSKIEEDLKGRSVEECKSRWQYLKSNKRLWTAEEVQCILNAHQEFGDNWNKISSLLNNCASYSVKYFFKRKLRSVLQQFKENKENEVLLNLTSEPESTDIKECFNETIEKKNSTVTKLWTHAEDSLLMESYAKFDEDWDKICPLFNKRSAPAVKRRILTLKEKNKLYQHNNNEEKTHKSKNVSSQDCISALNQNCNETTKINVDIAAQSSIKKNSKVKKVCTNENKCEKNMEEKSWNYKEDQKLISLVKQHGVSDWSKIAEKFSNRTNEEVQHRWTSCFSKRITKKQLKLIWTDEEDGILLYAYETHNGNWAEISKFVPGRCPIAVKHRFKYLEQKGLQRSCKTQVEYFPSSKTPTPVKDPIKKGKCESERYS